MAVVPTEPFPLWMLPREPGRAGREVQELTAPPRAAAFGGSSVAKLFQEVFSPKTFPANPHVSTGGGARR